MRRSISILLQTVMGLALVAALLAVPPAGAVGDVSDTVNIRLPGNANDPARLALRFSQTTFPDDSAPVVLMATDATFADALASGTLQANTPLLLTTTDDVRADVGQELERLGAEEVILLGGEAALDEGVEDELRDEGFDVTRLAGQTRLETAVAVAELADDPDTAIVSRAFAAGGDDSQAFADALAAGGWAAEQGWPTYLTEVDRLSDSTREALADGEVETVILLGGTAAISEQVETDLADLGVDVERVSGATRFATAVEVARERGFRDAGDADIIILVEGQAEDAWAAGFAAAAGSAAFDAPILLANGEGLPAETAAFLRQTRFAVTTDPITFPVLICAAEAAACDQARDLLGLPTEATVELDEPEDGVPSRSVLTGTIDLHQEDADVSVFGDCVTDGLVVPDAEDGTIELPVQALPGVCSLTFEIAFANGTVQTLTRPIMVAPALPQEGVVIDTETGGDAYTFTPDGGTAPVTVSYGEEDEFVVDGEPATIGAFEAAVTVADRLVFTADTADGTVHDLTNVDPSTITQGTAGNINLATGTLAIVEPVSGVVLRPGIALDAATGFAVDGTAVERPAFEADINEGDTVVVANRITLRNQLVEGVATAVDVDLVSGIVRFAVGGLGDDPANAEDDRFRLTGDADTEDYVIDGNIADFADVAEELTVGDEVSYEREGGEQVVRVTNRPLPPVDGLVTETWDPDGSPVAPEPSDGGSVLVLTAQGRVAITYAPEATFRIDGQIATEPEFEAARTSGDAISFQAGDPSTDTPEVIELDNRDLSGDLADITEGANTFDVVTADGIVHDDLPYTSAIFGGDDRYYDDGDEVDLGTFEDLLGLIDDGEQLATIVVRPSGGDTQHRLTFLD